MTSPTIDVSTLTTLNARRGTADIKLSEDGSAYTCTRVFGASPERVFRAFTDPEDLKVWFPGGAPEGSEMTRCDSDPVEGGTYRYAMTIPGFGEMSWFGNYTLVDRPGRIEAQEWFVMGDGGPEGDPSVQTLEFEALDGGMTRMTMHVQMPAPEDPEEFMEQSAAGLSSSLAALDELVSG